MSFEIVDLCAAHDVPVEGLIHVGANNAREYPGYHARTRGPLLYVEAIPDLARQVAAKLDPDRPHAVRQAVVSDTSGTEVTFHVASNNGLSSSLLPPGRHAEIYPDITFEQSLRLVTERLDDVVAEQAEGERFNVLVIDVQGAELQVLRGAPELLSRVDAVFAEVSSEPLYEGGCTFAEVTSLLDEAGLVFRAARMGWRGWGDAFYSRTDGTMRRMLRANLALGRPTRQSSHRGRRPAVAPVVDDVLPDDFGVHTAGEDPAPFWEVDLGEVRPISRLLHLDRRNQLKRAASLELSTSVDGERYEVVHRRDPATLGNLLDVAVEGRARFVRVSLPDGGPLHFRKLVVL